MSNNTQSNFMSSYGPGDMFYDVEASEIDELDNEVSNIAKKRFEKKNDDMIKPEDVKIDFAE